MLYKVTAPTLFAKQVCCWSRFMRSHTVGHQSILDPTGSLPVYPSQATLVKDWSFGMGTGTASAELIAKYQQLNPDVEPNQILLPRRLRYKCCLFLCTMLPVFMYHPACVCIQCCLCLYTMPRETSWWNGVVQCADRIALLFMHAALHRPYQSDSLCMHASALTYSQFMITKLAVTAAAVRTRPFHS